MEKDPLLLGFITPLLPKFLLTVEMGKAVSHKGELGSFAGYCHVQSSHWPPQQRRAAGSLFTALLLHSRSERDPLQPRESHSPPHFHL